MPGCEKAGEKGDGYGENKQTQACLTREIGIVFAMTNRYRYMLNCIDIKHILLLPQSGLAENKRKKGETMINVEVI